MPIKKKLTLGLGLLVLASTALADTYTIKSGDTIEVIAKRLGVRQQALMDANGINAKTVLRIGRELKVPGSSTSKDKKSAKRVPSGGKYVVRNGDHDWTIAKKHGITPQQLHALNPGLNWRKLQIGQAINVPGTKVAKATTTKSPVKKATSSGTHHASVSSVKTISSRFAVVTGDNVTIRRGPGTDKAAITQVDSGIKVTVLDRDGQWYKARFPKGTEAWIRGDFLKAVTAAVVKSSAPAAKVAAKKPSTKSTVVAKKGDSSGFVTQNIVASQKKGSTVDKVLTKARSMRGVRYKWGAASRSATDCSGFTTQAYKAVGITIPRTSSAQATAGIAVAKKDLKPGDLVFFRTTRGRRISHVGIYTGNGKFIHASSGGGKVMESSLNEGYYQSRYVTARRIVKASKQALVQSLPKPGTDVSIDPITDPASEEFSR